MAVPFRRTSKTTKRMRRTHFKLSVSGLVTCPNCGARIVSHRVCPQCGYYDGKQVIAVGDNVVKEEKKPVKKAAKATKKAETKTESESKPVKKTSKKTTKKVEKTEE